MTYYMGIDPGALSGAWAIIDEDGRWIDSGGADCFECFDIDNYKPVLTVLEHVWAFKGQGVSSSFSFGANFGGWEATLRVHKLDYKLVSPRTWQNAVLGRFPKGQSKPTALRFAQKTWPERKCLKKDHGVVDALCIALYAKRLHQGLNFEV